MEPSVRPVSSLVRGESPPEDDMSEPQEHTPMDERADASAVPVPIPYDPGAHFEQVLRWMEAWGQTISPDALPTTGFIVPGIAAGFLYRTDSSIAWIEGLVASRDISAEIRGLALDEIVRALRAEARRSGFKILLGYTQLQAVVDRALRHGFKHAKGAYQLVVAAP
jgi:hypothetical protein